MATKQIKLADMNGFVSGFYMHGETVNFTLTDARPKTRLWAFFNEELAPELFAPTDGVAGDPLITDEAGRLTGTFTIPDFTYYTGSRLVKFQDSPVYTADQVPGSSVSGAQATFTGTRIEQTVQDTITIVNTVVDTVVNTSTVDVVGGLGDPLAQSFFTYGVTGGCGITKMDLFFASKDDSLPVILEIRHLVNGYPSPNLVAPEARVSLLPSEVNLSDDASLATTFTFPYPITLAENGDYCFVLLSNSNQYNVWTSKMGDVSVETGMKVFDQPFIGSLFKSENNKTWTANQTEDIKFTMYKAVYNTNPVTVQYDTTPKQLITYGTVFSVIEGQSTVRAKLTYQHGLRTGDYIGIDCVTDGSFRGLTKEQLTGNFQVTVVDQYTVTFQVGAVATSTGTLKSGGIVNAVQIDNGGSNYSNPTITFAASPSGTTATGTLTIANGVITDVTITNPGSGYTGVPSYTITDSTGSGAVLAVISEAIFYVATNRVTNISRVLAATYVPSGSTLDTTIHSTGRDYSVLSDERISLKGEYQPKYATMLVSDINRQTFLAGQKPLAVTMTLGTNNPNTSPLINLAEPPRVATVGYAINNQTALEDLTADAPTGTVTGTTPGELDITAGGAGYTTATVTISAPDLSTGVQATATATVTNGVVTKITVTESGSGYVKVPSVTITGTGNITAIAAAQASLTPFNTELLPNGGTALSRYMSKPIVLATVSSGVHVTATAYSGFESSFDVYVRTSLSTSGVNHGSLNWTILNCDVERNKSTKRDDYRDYHFYLDKIPNFDVYDIKIVMRSTSQVVVPRIKSYNVITLAT